MSVPKFKVWDKSRKVMSKPFGFGDLFGYEGEANAVTLAHPYIPVGQDFTIAEHKGGSFRFPQLAPYEGVNPDLVFLEFTGMKDAKGKEICEGDIVSRHGTKGLNCVLPISGGWKLFIDDMTTDRPDRYEVVGNIYENPELLKETK